MQKLSTTILLTTLIFKTTSNAFQLYFQAKAVVPRHTDVSVLMGMVQPNDFGDDDFDLDIEAARKKLESLVGDGFVEQQEPSLAILSNGPLLREHEEIVAVPQHDDHTIYVPEAPPLTTIERERRETEIAILHHLAQGDDVLADLWMFWFHERGANAAARLTQAEALSAQKETWNEAEKILLELIDAHGVRWVEPVNRLATLYYLQGRLDESERLARTVLKIKPWHVGALSGIVLVYAGQNASEKARAWAARRLPVFAPSGSNRRREQWVERAVSDASKALVDAEKRLESLFGEKDKYPSRPTQEDFFDRNDDDAWQ